MPRISRTEVIYFKLGKSTSLLIANSSVFTVFLRALNGNKVGYSIDGSHYSL